MPGRLLVDLLGYTGGRGGTEKYAREIVRRLPDELPRTALAAITGRAGGDAVRSFFPGTVRVLPFVGADRVSWAAGAVGGIELFARTHGADAVWCPANFGPVVRGVPRVVTVHDVIYDEVPGSVVQAPVRAVTAALIRGTARTATAVLSGSAAAADSVARSTGIDRGSIVVIPHGTDPPTVAPSSRDDLEALGVDPSRPLVLSTGNRMPHKNFAGLVRALAAMEPTSRPQLVITGGSAADPLAGLADSLGVRGDLVLPGWVTEAQLEDLYAAADLYVCPSRSEGFGLPVIDALRRGVPVLANDIPVLREVGGDAAAYADAADPRHLAAAMTVALSRPDDAARREAGIARASRFTWTESAGRTAQVLDRVMRRGRAR